MSRDKGQAQCPLEVRSMFEPTRLAAEHLADAYAQVVPPRRKAPHGYRSSPECVVRSQGTTGIRRAQR